MRLPGPTTLDIQAHELIHLVGLLDEEALIVQRSYQVEKLVMGQGQHLRHLSHLIHTEGVLEIDNIKRTGKDEDIVRSYRKDRQSE